MRSITQWLAEYGESHQNPMNKRLHWVCVPVIVWCVIGLLWSLPVPPALRQVAPLANWAILVVAAAVLYYALLSLPLAAGAALAFAAMLWSIDRLAQRGAPPLWCVCAVLFVLAWILHSSATRSRASGRPFSRTCNFY